MGGFDLIGLLPFVLIFGIFYFLILRPQQQKMKKHQNMLANLRRGDRVVTSGGLIGTISKIVNDTEVQLELTDEIRVRQVRGMITEVLAKTDPITSTTASKKEGSLPAVRKAETSKPKTVRKAAANRSTGKTKG